jgi:hypothetical protein
VRQRGIPPWGGYPLSQAKEPSFFPNANELHSFPPKLGAGKALAILKKRLHHTTQDTTEIRSVVM